VICHVGFIPNPALKLPELESRFVHSGHTGVILFFLVSSFTMSLSSVRRGHETNHLAKFYFRRLFRILPLFYFCVLLACLRDLYIQGSMQSPKIILESIIGVFQPGKADGIVWASWTLGIELVFYMIFPFLFAIANTMKRAVFLLAVTVFADLLVARVFIGDLPTAASDASVRYTLIHNLPYFILGMIFYFIFASLRDKGYGGRRIGYTVTAAAIAIFIGLLIWHPAAFASLTGGGYYLVAASMVLFMLGLLLHPTQMIVNPITTFLGKISYSLYLLHPPLVFLLIPLFRYYYLQDSSDSAAYLMSLLTTLVILVPVAYLSFLIIESPGIRLGSSLIKRFL
jgi:peptidoglycan/LPS O-acetylase OafA/YrhL